jgi:dTDP-glucose pyrophosphorylase
MNQGEKGIVLVTDDHGRLLDTVVDGDVRRALLSGIDFNGPLSDLLQSKNRFSGTTPVTAPQGSDKRELITIMKKYKVRQLPLVDEHGQVVDLVTEGDLLPSNETQLQAMVMAGGLGMRLRPLTEDCPKPLLPVGDTTLLGHILEQLKQSGVRRVNLSTYYMADKIRERFGDGRDYGVELSYLNEDRPLGTAGALGLMETPSSPLLIINGDILTQVDFKAMLQFHQEHQALLTVGVRQYDVNVPFGVLQCQGEIVRGLEEKPVYKFFVNAGVYLMEPDAQGLIKQGEHLDMTDLIERLLTKGKKVVSFPIIEYWLDVGNPSDYQQAQEDAQNGKLNP